MTKRARALAVPVVWALCRVIASLNAGVSAVLRLAMVIVDAGGAALGGCIALRSRYWHYFLVELSAFC